MCPTRTGIDRRPIGWQSTRRQQIEDALPVLTARYEERQGDAPGERAAYAPGRRPDASAQTHGDAVADRAADAMALLGDPGVRRLHRLPAGTAGAGGGRSGVGAGAAGGRRSAGGRRRRRRGVRDARRVQAPPPARRSPPPPLLRPAPSAPPGGSGRTDRADGRRRLHPPADLRALYPRDTEDQAVLPTDTQADLPAVRAGTHRRRRTEGPRPGGAPRGPTRDGLAGGIRGVRGVL